ncbi:MAG: sugar ABC transporter ATP-binding protein, partial [Bacteroidetes bacterium]|nr:sugar ABC transporter ATP-binding protein [Bacteroidota bacterium]
MLSAKNITKKFPGVTALENVNLELSPGKVTAIIGENGAGKSTLMKILSGVHTDYEGIIELENKVVQFKNTREAQEKGVAIIHQELILIPYLNVTENLFLGRELINIFGLLDKGKMRNEALEILKKLQLNIDPDTKVHNLKVGQQQLIEIAKALLIDARVIIMDEPTSAITGAEVEVLFGIIDNLKKEGKAIAYISHKLDELFQIADQYVVLKDGKFAGAGEMPDVNHDQLVAMMVGREIELRKFTKTDLTSENESILLNITDLQLPQFEYPDTETGISFQLKKGEIVGIFGLMGAGRTELLETIFGLYPNQFSGKVIIEEQKQNIKSTADAVKAGLAFVSEDRKGEGIIPELSVKKNISLTILPQLATNGILNVQKEKQLAETYISDLKIKTSSQAQLIKNLSGGNQQEVILAKWLATNPKIL